MLFQSSLFLKFFVWVVDCFVWFGLGDSLRIVVFWICIFLDDLSDVLHINTSTPEAKIPGLSILLVESISFTKAEGKLLHTIIPKSEISLVDYSCDTMQGTSTPITSSVFPAFLLKIGLKCRFLTVLFTFLVGSIGLHLFYKDLFNNNINSSKYTLSVTLLMVLSTKTCVCTKTLDWIMYHHHHLLSSSLWSYPALLHQPCLSAWI